MNGKVSTLIRRFARGNEVMISRIKAQFKLANSPERRRIVSEMRKIISIRKQKSEVGHDTAQQPSV